MSTHTHACIHYVDHVCPFHRLSSERAISNSGITKLSSFLPLSRSFSLSSSVHNTTSKSFLVLFLLGMYDAAGKSEGGAASARRRQTERPTGRTTESVRWRSAYFLRVKPCFLPPLSEMSLRLFVVPLRSLTTNDHSLAGM